MNNDVSHSTVMRLGNERGSRVGSHVLVATARNLPEVNCPMQEVAGRKDFSISAKMAGFNPVQIRAPTFPYRFFVSTVKPA